MFDRAPPPTAPSTTAATEPRNTVNACSTVLHQRCVATGPSTTPSRHCPPTPRGPDEAATRLPAAHCCPTTHSDRTDVYPKGVPPEIGFRQLLPEASLRAGTGNYLKGVPPGPDFYRIFQEASLKVGTGISPRGVPPRTGFVLARTPRGVPQGWHRLLQRSVLPGPGLTDFSKRRP